MPVGCFSWCRLLTQRGAKKQSVVVEFDESHKLWKNRLLGAFEATSVEDPITEPKSDEELSETTRALVPTTKQYIVASGKQSLTLLQSAASVIPVPLLQEAIGVALKIIEVCEEASAIEQKVKELQDRVGYLMVVIVDHVTAKNEEGSKEAVVKAAKGIEEDIKGLVSTLGTINRDLAEISAQNRWVIAFYKKLNMSTLEDCINRLSTALDRFKVHTFSAYNHDIKAQAPLLQLANDLRDSDLLQKLQSRLEKIQHLTQHVADKVDNIDDKVEDIRTILFKLKRSGTMLVSDKLVRQEMPLKPEIFHGRDDLVEDIARLLMTEETSHVCILGPGGMGKTSVSLAVVESPLVQERYPAGSRFWVPCLEATSATLLLETLYVQMQVPGDKQVTLEKIISALEELNQPCLILLDNFETPWNAPGGTQKQVGDILRKLTTLKHVAILVTMRGTYPPCETINWQSQTIQPTDQAACRRIFHDINPSSKDDPDVGHLLAALGHMPFAVTLMANLGKRGKSTVKQLLDSWYTSGTDMLSVTNSPEKSMNRSISLSVDSDFVKRDPDALLLLTILSLLPAGTTTQNLRWWAPTIKMIPSAIATLSDAALLVENKRKDIDSSVLFVLPVVQSFMQQQDRTTEEIRMQIHSSCCQYVLDHACRYDESAFPVKSKALAAEDPNIQSILLGSLTMQAMSSSNITTEALIAFSWHRCDTKPDLNIAKHALAVANASGVKIYIASAVWCLGKTYQQLGDHRPSYDFLQEAYQLFKALPPGEAESQRLGGQCGTDLVNEACLALKDKSEAVSLARDVEKKCAALSDDLVHGRSLMLLGKALNAARERQEALVHLEHAKTMLKAVNNTPNLATACQTIARVHYYERRLPEALDAIDEAWKRAQLTDSPYIQGIISREFSKILFSANRDTEAWMYIEIALMRALYVGDQLTIANALEYMGYGYLRRGDYQNAYSAYEAAAERYPGTVEAWCGKTCKENMARIKQKQANIGMEIGFHRHGFDFETSLFYPPVQLSANDVPISIS
ncbi:hypothetical protein M413DRAFT_29445 [Hebeloma cylindrosporum]|uniref:Novel STAND NTPase 1 domain-containing protein n=1 Tax=Hebeloma cylindrosporum TaxID=76867 RepID=A0A0C3BRH1_HEBCY|nr:hypothetical protein M413DRAFT_29445 [Hebeloma cylindrosporum h7]